MSALFDAVWQGFKRKDGAKGIRNKVLVVYTVECSSFVAKAIGANFRQSGDDVDVIGFQGCTDNEYAVRMMLALIRHPNVGAVLIVGLGCEYLQANLLAEKARESGRLAEWLLIQECGGTKASIDHGTHMVKELAEHLSRETEKISMSLRDVIIGAECGGSDFTSGLAGNVVVGRMFDMLVDAGGTAIFEEIVEAIGLKAYLVERGRTQEAKQELARVYDKMLGYCRKVRQYSVSPGNFAGGLTTIEEKSMGAIAKSGSRPIEGVIKASQKPDCSGLWLLDSTPDPHYMDFGYTNPNDNEGLMDLAASGAHLLFLVTGRGTVVGSAVSPVVKITGNDRTFQKMIGDMDFNASPALSGTKSMDQLALELLGLVVDTCAGRQTKSEQLGHKEYYIPYKYQSMEPHCER